MAEDANDGGDGSTSDTKKQNDGKGAGGDPQKAEHLSGLSSQDQDEAEE